MKTSEQIDKLAEALSKAQGLFQNPEKNKTAKIPMKAGGSYSYDYADLPESLNVTRKALAENGLSHICTVSYVGDEGIPMLLGRLLHSSGQWIESEFLLPNSPDPKQIAASMTYGRRYLFNALTGIAADDDIDAGEDNVEYKLKDKKVFLPPDISGERRPSEAQLKRLFAIMNDCQVKPDQLKAYILSEFKKNSTKELTLREYDQTIDAMTSGEMSKSAPWEADAENSPDPRVVVVK